MNLAPCSPLQKIKIKRIKCPSCKQQGVRLLREFGTVSQIFMVRDSWRDADGDIGEVSGGGGVQACCRCGHEWKLKGVSQIDDLDYGN